MENLENWYKREVYSWRCASSLGWTLFTQPLIFIIYIFFSNIEIFHPVSWVVESISAICSMYFVTMVILLTVTTVVLWTYSTSTFTVIPEISETRLNSLLGLLKPKSLVHCMICIGAGSFTAWICSSVIGGRYSGLSFTDSDNSAFLNEYHLFLVLYGMYTGIFYQFHHYIHQNNYIHFPVLHQTKYFQVRSGILSELIKSSYNVFWQTVYFYPVFWMFGHIPKDWIIHNLSFERVEQPLDSIWGLMDVCLLWQTLMCGMFIQFTWSFGAMLYKLYQSEHFIFPIESDFEESKAHCLIDAMNCKTNPLIQHLGYMDLCYLSEHSVFRRCQVFSLSQPGGHPHNWNKICTACLAEVNSLNQKLQEENWKVFAAAPVRQPTSDRSGIVNTSSSVGNGTSVTYRGSANVSNTSDTATGGGGAGGENISQQSPQDFKDMIISYLKKRPLFSYLLTEQPDAKSRQLFVSSQIQIWAVEALSNFATASYREDKYGVVQKSLPDIVLSLVNLLENVEKHFKLATVSRRSQKDLGASDLALRYLLQTSLKCSMYKIINTFGKHIMSVHLPPDCVRKLKQFMDYKE